MKVPNVQNIYCPKCNKHTEHKLKAFKSGKARALSIGTRSNIRKHKMGYGGKAKFTATVKKQNKKPSYLAECTVCQRKVYLITPKRMKKTELTALNK
ncbi:50S ribosomal protein L44e [uncultured archaeon]|nr:50S ribosomal protein L44e [uncultured archaeon]